MSTTSGRNARAIRTAVAPSAASATAAPSSAVVFPDSWTDQVLDRIMLAPVYRIEAVLILPLVIVLFLAGSRLLRAGALADDVVGRRIRTRLMAVGLGVAAPLNLLTTFGPPPLEASTAPAFSGLSGAIRPTIAPLSPLNARWEVGVIISCGQRHRLCLHGGAGRKW